MPKLHRTVKNLFINGWAWLLDYVYVIFWQVHGIIRPLNPTQYLSKNTGGTEQQIPVVLLPGIYENWQFMKPLADMLYNQGYSVHVIPDIGRTTGRVEDLAAQVKKYLVEHRLTQCILVAHSKGGLIGKNVLIDPEAEKRVRGMIALNTPFSGSPYAHFIPVKSVRDFIPNSPTLATLAQNSLVNARIISIYGLFDPHIPKGSYLEGAENIQLAIRGHFRILHNTKVHETVLAALQRFTPPHHTHI